MTTTTVTVKVVEASWMLFEKIIEAAEMRRDAYLSKVLPGELDLLEELPANGPHHAKKLKGFLKLSTVAATRKVSITLDSGVSDRLNKLCTEKNIPRDLFIAAMLNFLNTRLFMPAKIIRHPRAEDREVKNLPWKYSLPFTNKNPLERDYYRQCLYRSDEESQADDENFEREMNDMLQEGLNILEKNGKGQA